MISELEPVSEPEARISVVQVPALSETVPVLDPGLPALPVRHWLLLAALPAQERVFVKVAVSPVVLPALPAVCQESLYLRAVSGCPEHLAAAPACLSPVPSARLYVPRLLVRPVLA